MLKVFVGAQQEVQQVVSGKQALIEDIAWEHMSVEELLTLATTQSLMGDVRTLRFTGALDGALAEDFLDNATELVRSVHQFICIEEKLLKKPTDLLTKAGALLVVGAAQKKAQKSGTEPFNIFSLTYAFAFRDRKKLWLLLHEALESGVVPEAIAGILHWKVRDMLSKKELGKFTRVELEHLSYTLVSLYHDSHRGAGNLGLLLERFALTL